MSATFTKNELLEMWKRPKERQLAIMDAKILEAFNMTEGQIAIAWSGGKDSTTLLWRTALHWVAVFGKRPLVVVFADTTNEVRETYQFIDWFIPWLTAETGVVIDFRTSRPAEKQTYISVVKQYGLPLISKSVSKAIRRIRKFLKERNLTWDGVKEYTASNHECVAALKKLGCNKTLVLYLTGWVDSKKVFSRKYKLAKKWLPLIPAEEIVVSEECCDHLKKLPMKEVQKTAKCKNCMIGEMACDSKQREEAYLETGCTFFSKGIVKSKPCGAMTEQTMLWIIDYFKVPQSKYYGVLMLENGEYRFSDHQRGGCALCGFGIEHEPDRFIKLQKTDPAKVRIAFTPLAQGGLGYLEACTFLNEQCGMKIQIPDVSRGAAQ